MPSSKPALAPKILIPEDKLQVRVRELAQEIARDYAGKEVTAICILKGSFIFYSDILRYCDLPVTCEFLGLSSYGNRKTSSGEVKTTLDFNEPLENRHVIVFEDIVDTGLTLQFIARSIQARNPASVKICSLLLKPNSLKTDVVVDYVGFPIGDEFVVGYGIDCAEKHRGLPYIGIMENEH